MFRITSPALRPCPHVCSPVRHGNRYSEAFGLSWPRIVQLREAGVGIRTQASRALDATQSSCHILPATLSPFILTPGLPGESKRPSHHTGTVRMGQTKPLGQGHAGWRCLSAKPGLRPQLVAPEGPLPGSAPFLATSVSRRTLLSLRPNVRPDALLVPSPNTSQS